jgi:mevalonate kinase
VAGGYIAINGGAEGRLLWEVADERHRWTVRRLPDPGWTWVVAYSGIPRDTATTVRAVADRVAGPDGAARLDELERIALEGLRGLVDEDRARVGARMNDAHARLAELGVSHPRLEALREAVAPAADGAKLTGAGAGGSLLVLPKAGRETEAVRRLGRAGGVAFAVRCAPAGSALVDAPRAEDPAAAPAGA